MKKYKFKIYQDFGNRELDDQNVWTSANSQSEAEANIRSEYWGIKDIILLSVENFDDN